MAVWTVVQAKTKKPGGSGGAQVEQDKSGGEEVVCAGASDRFTCKIRAEFIHSGKNGGFKALAEAKQLVTHFNRIEPTIVFKSENDTRITFSKPAEFPSSQNRFKEFFTVTPHSTRSDGSGKAHVNFLIESKHRLQLFKHDPTLMQYLRDRKIWLVEHKYETHSLQAIGFIVNKSPVLTHRPQFENDIVTALRDYTDDKMDDTMDKFVPDMEISGKRVVHVLRDGDKKIGVMETQALEIRCESAHSEQLKILLCNAALPEHRFGKFVPYQLAKNDPTVVKDLIAEHNRHLTEITAIPIFGLHRDALYSLVDGEKFGGDDEQLKEKLLKQEIEFETDEGEKTGTEPVFLSIEETQRSDDLGKWFLIVKKLNVATANKVIDNFLIPAAETTIAHHDHKNDGESFKSGIRRTNTPNKMMQNYAELLRNSTTHQRTENGQDYDKHNYVKKRQMVIVYDNQEFPALPPAPKKRNQQQHSTQKNKNNTANKNAGQQTMTTSSATNFTSYSSSSNSSNNGSDAFTAYKNSVEAQLEVMRIQIGNIAKMQEESQKKQAAAETGLAGAMQMLQLVMDNLNENVKSTKKLEEVTEARHQHNSELLHLILASVRPDLVPANKRGAQVSRPTPEPDKGNMDIEGEISDDDSKRRKQQQGTDRVMQPEQFGGKYGIQQGTATVTIAKEYVQNSLEAALEDSAPTAV